MSRGLGKIEKLILQRLEEEEGPEYVRLDSLSGSSSHDSILRAARSLSSKGYIQTAPIESRGQVGARLRWNFRVGPCILTFNLTSFQLAKTK
jgi:hypothetical protein